MAGAEPIPFRSQPNMGRVTFVIHFHARSGETLLCEEPSAATAFNDKVAKLVASAGRNGWNWRPNPSHNRSFRPPYPAHRPETDKPGARTANLSTGRV